ncbi:MAG: sigma-70 family RNA polymerase sigma factor [Muribaculaceae bacterium]|nr:sigma-70 family RNA polymerase sigma factor [Muribaculaceae bacterium]
MTETEFRNSIMPLYKQMYACAFVILRDENDAADCLQDSFTKLWENRQRLKQLDNPVGYAITTVRNTALNMVSRKVIAADSFSEYIPEIPDDTSSPSLKIEKEEAERKISNIFSLLPEQQKKVMELSSIGGLSNTEISKATGFSDENVRVLLSRARKKIKAFIYGNKKQ